MMNTQCHAIHTQKSVGGLIHEVPNSSNPRNETPLLLADRVESAWQLGEALGLRNGRSGSPEPPKDLRSMCLCIV